MIRPSKASASISEKSPSYHVNGPVTLGFSTATSKLLVAESDFAEIQRSWAPDSWEQYGQFIVLETGDDPAIVESVTPGTPAPINVLSRIPYREGCALLAGTHDRRVTLPCSLTQRIFEDALTTSVFKSRTQILKLARCSTVSVDAVPSPPHFAGPLVGGLCRHAKQRVWFANAVCLSKKKPQGRGNRGNWGEPKRGKSSVEVPSGQIHRVTPSIQDTKNKTKSPTASSRWGFLSSA